MKFDLRGVFCAMLCALSANVFAVEYIRQETPHPGSATATQTSLEDAFEPRVGRLARSLAERLEWRVRERIGELPPFFADATLDYESRMFNFDRRDDAGVKREALAVGGQFRVTSGWWRNVQLSAAYYGSWGLDTNGQGGTGLLAPNERDIQIFGEANLTYRFTGERLGGAEMRLGRQQFSLPYVNKQDIRMIPITHEGYTLYRRDSAFNFIVGHLTKMKKFDADEFVYLSEVAGAPGTDQGVSLFGAELFNNGTVTLGAINYYGWDTFNTLFVDGSYARTLDEQLDFKLAGQFTDQRSVGDELVDAFDTWHGSLQGSLGWRGTVVKVAASVTGEGSQVQHPWGGSPGHLSLQRLDFDRAGERALLIGASHNSRFLSRFGFSSFFNVAWGWDAVDPVTQRRLPDRREYDLTIDFKPPKGRWQGLWVRARAAFVDMENDGRDWHDNRDFRLIVNYEIPIF